MAKLRRICFLLLAAALTIVAALAQQTTGIIKGTLLDDSGASVPAANVTLSGPGNAKTVKTAQTQADGTYTFSGLVPGNYVMGVAYPGFATISKPVTVTAGQTLTVPVQLSVQAEKQTLEVKGESTVTVSVEPDNNATALVIKGEDLASLPDDPDDLADALQALAGPGAGPNGGQIYIDGFSGGQLPPKESIREIRINQNPFSAEFDRLGFGRIEILTKPGSDHVHGSIRYNDTDSLFDSRNPFENSKPAYSVRNLSGNVGGPLSHRASYFLDMSRRSITNNEITLATYVDPSTYSLIPVNTPVVAPTVQYNISPRLDYQLSTNNTLTVRFENRWNTNNNSGLGGYKLPPGFMIGNADIPPSDFGYTATGDAQNLMITETNILTPKIVNETRFQFTRTWTSSAGNEIPAVNVSGEFQTGGNGLGDMHDLGKHFELQNYTSISHGTHTIRFGARARRESDQNNNPSSFNGTFTFLGGNEPVLNSANQIVYNNGVEETTLLTSAQQYIRQLQLTAAGLSETAIQALGGGPSRFAIQAGEPYISYTRYDAGPFVQDDWRIKPNLTLSLGLRYEVQTLVSGKGDFAPRLGFAWAPGNAKNGRQKTVIRGGGGIFYDRVSYSDFEQAALNNGHTQLQYEVYNPTFYPDIPSLSSLSLGQNATYIVDPKLRADYSMQGAIGVERQLPRNTRLSTTYTYTHMLHLAQTVPINTPFPGTFNPLLPLSATNGVFPYGYNAGNIYEYESGGKFNQSIVMVGLNTAVTKNISLNVNYSLTYAKDLPSTPSDPYDFMLDYGRSNLDRRNNLSVFGNVIAPLGIRFAPFITLRSGAPYDVEIGEDIFGDTYSNVRAAYAPTGSACGGNVVCTKYGDFSTAVTATNLANLVPRNLLSGPSLISVNGRIYRVFGFGPRRGGNANNATNGGGGPDGGGPGGGGPGGGGPPGGGGGFGGGSGGGRGGGGGGGGGGGRGGGGGGMSMGPRGGGRGGGTMTEHRFNLTVGVNVTNILNHFNPTGYVGNLTSTYFGQPTGANTSFGGGGVGGGGAGSSANNRRLDFSVALNF